MLSVGKEADDSEEGQDGTRRRRATGEALRADRRQMGPHRATTAEAVARRQMGRAPHCAQRDLLGAQTPERTGVTCPSDTESGRRSTGDVGAGSAKGCSIESSSARMYRWTNTAGLTGACLKEMARMCAPTAALRALRKRRNIQTGGSGGRQGVRLPSHPRVACAPQHQSRDPVSSKPGAHDIRQEELQTPQRH